MRREHHLHPILDGDLDRVGFPIGLVFGDLILLAAVPIHCGADKLIRRSARLDLADAIRQFDQRLHHIGLGARRLQRVIHTPETPHARHIMLRDVAVEHELAGQGLQAPRSTLNHLIVDLCRPDGLHVQTVEGSLIAGNFTGPFFDKAKSRLLFPGWRAQRMEPPWR